MTYKIKVHWGRAALRTVDTGQRRLGVELHAQDRVAPLVEMAV